MAKSDVLDALVLATKMHMGQFRKGTKIPYIKHIIDVYDILNEEHVDDDVLIIGILHDVVEDTPLTFEDVRKLFGDDVCYGVYIESEDKSISDYNERKMEHCQRVLSSPPEIQLVNCADKLANLRDMISDYNQIGDKLFDRFKKGKQGVFNYYDYLANHYNLTGYKTYNEFVTKYEQFKKNVNCETKSIDKNK